MLIHKHRRHHQLGGSQLLKSNRLPAATGDWEHVNKELLKYGYCPVIQDIEKKYNNIYTL